MAFGENLFDNLLTVSILLVLGLIIYLRVTQRTITDFIRDLREAFSEPEVDGYYG